MVENFTISLYGARWVALEWVFGFDGNSDIISFRVRVIQENKANIITEATNQDTRRYCINTCADQASLNSLLFLAIM